MGLTRPRAEQIFNLDYKQATRVVTTTNINLTGGAPVQVDGVNLTANDRVLVTGQTTASQNGLYLVVTVGAGSNGTWTRTNDGNDTGEIEAGMIVMVTEGVIYADTQWKLITDNPIVIGTTDLIFTQNYSANSIAGGTSNVTVYSNANVTISSAGTPNVLIVSSTGTVTTGTASVSGNITGGNLLTGGLISATGNITGGNANINGVVNVTTSLTVADGAYGNMVTTQFASMYGSAKGPNPYSIVQVRSNDGTSGMGMQAYANLNSLLYSNLGFTFQTGATLRDKDFPTGGTTKATIDSTGLSVTGIASASGNITGGNVLTGGFVSATGNITGSYIIGNGSQLTGLPASYSNANVSSFLSAFGSNTISTTGNVTAGYFLGNGSSLSSITGANVSGTVANATYALSANVSTYSGTVTDNAQSNITSVGTLTSLTSTGNISTTGNIAGNYILGNGASLTGVVSSYGNSNVDSHLSAFGSNTISTTGTVTAGNVTGSNILTGGIVSATANITGGNVLTSGLISAAGNITGSYILGNGSQLTGINLSTSTIFNGSSNINISSSNSNISMAVAGAADTVVVSTGEITVDGVYSNPKTIAGNVVITENINSMMIGPIALGPLGNIYVPNSSTLKIL